MVDMVLLLRLVVTAFAVWLAAAWIDGIEVTSSGHGTGWDLVVLLGIAARELPIGTAYAVWVGIGAAGAAIGGIFLFGEAASAGRLFFLGMLLLSIVGLKATSGA